ncbi:MAG: polyisoprenoid-binding protein [Ignavibacteriales bacterium]|nr:MAG: polyisoprenoid-binding protein [Ignavibacteriales bacterium]
MIKTFLAIALMSAAMFAQGISWKFDPSHSQVKFNVTHLVISEVTGHFNKFDGTVKTIGNDFTDAQIEFTIETSSIDTDNEKRDNHLRSDDFFNAEKYPKMKFVSKSMKKVGDNEYKLIGDLTIRDITKQVELDVEHGGIASDGYGNTKAGFKITGTINRFDFNLKWNALLEAGGAVVGSDVEMECNIQLVKESV